jgi:hypothetical protein
MTNRNNRQGRTNSAQARGQENVPLWRRGGDWNPVNWNLGSWGREDFNSAFRNTKQNVNQNPISRNVGWDDFIRTGEAIRDRQWGRALKSFGTGVLEAGSVIVPGGKLRLAAKAGTPIARGAAARKLFIPPGISFGFDAAFPQNRSGVSGPISRSDPYNMRDRQAMANAYRQMGMTSNYGMGAGPSTAPGLSGQSGAGGAGGGGGGGYVSGPTSTDGDLGTQLPLSPAEQAMFDQARIDALEQLNMERAALDLQRRGGSLQNQEALRAAGRMGATEAADLQSVAAESGFASSPATLGVGMSEIAQEEARRRMASQAQYRGLQEQIRTRGAQAQSEYQRFLDNLKIQEAAARSARGVSNVQARYGI